MADNGVNGKFTVGATKINIYRADIIKLEVDVIVNAVNKDIKDGGGLDKALAGAAGSDLVKECENIIKTNGFVKIAQVVKTTSGKLPCKAVFHAVCPKWVDTENSKEQDECLVLLKTTLENVLADADRSGYRSIALPPISAGTFGVPSKLVAKVMAITIRLAAERNKWLTLTEIHVIDVKDDILGRVIDNLEESGCINETPEPVTEAGFLIGNAFSVYIYRADITKVKVDAIVNATDKNLKHEGGLARAISEAAGPEFNKECKKIISKEGQVKIAGVVQTTGGLMSCKLVLHTVGPIYPFIENKKQLDICGSQLTRAFVNALRSADEKSHSSIALPPISAGDRGMPESDVAIAMVEAFKSYALTTKTPKLKDIHVVDIKDDVLPLVIAMLDQFRQKDAAIGQRVSIQRITVDVKPPISDNGFYAAFMVQYSITIQIYRADITKLKVDAIVSAATKDLGHVSGVSKAIALVAGPEFVHKCKEIHRELGDMSIAQVVDSMAGKLPCKAVFHAVGPKWLTDKSRRQLDECRDMLRRTFENVLTFANKPEIINIAVPPICSGINGVPIGDVARAMVEGIKSFALKNNNAQLKEIHVVDIKDDILALVIGLLNMGGYKDVQNLKTVSVERTTIKRALIADPDDERMKQKKQTFVQKLFTGGPF